MVSYNTPAIFTEYGIGQYEHAIHSGELKKVSSPNHKQSYYQLSDFGRLVGLKIALVIGWYWSSNWARVEPTSNALYILLSSKMFRIYDEELNTHIQWCWCSLGSYNNTSEVRSCHILRFTFDYLEC